MMQNSTTSNGAASWTMDDGAQSRNLAAIALAEAMHRARMQTHGETQLADVPVAATLSPKTRLDALRKKLKPLYAAIPQDVDGIDLGVVREEKPRLFLDMVAYIDISEDQKSYRLVQGGRNGAQVLLETADETLLIVRITDYIAQRLIVRERIIEQGDPVVVGAAHFSRGVTAGLAQNHLVSEPALMSAQAKQFEAPTKHPDELKSSEVQAEHHQVQKSSNLGVSENTSELRKTFANTAHVAPSYAKSMATSSTQSSVFPQTAQSVSSAANTINSWWLWPTLAMLFGMGLAAYLLYLYSMSFTS